MEVVGGVAILEIEVLHDGEGAKAVGIGNGEIGTEITNCKFGYESVESEGTIGTEAVDMPVLIAL